MRLKHCAFAGVLLSVSAVAAAAPPNIYNLGTLGGPSSQASAINNAGQVAGVAGDAPWHAFLYPGTSGSGGMMHDLGTFGGTYSIGVDINDSGQIVGESHAVTPHSRISAFLYTGTPGSGGTMHDLGTLGGISSVGINSWAYGVNDRGQVVGKSTTLPNFHEHVFLYSGTPGVDGTMHDLGINGYGSDINNSGQIVGMTSDIAVGFSRAFLYTGTPGIDGVMHDLGSIHTDDVGSRAFAINDRGQVTGSYDVWAWENVSYSRAFLYTGTPGVDGIMHDLGIDGVGVDINDRGQVVGTECTFNENICETPRAFVYTGIPGVDGQIIDLNAWVDANNPVEGAKWTLTHGSGINDNGLITGNGNYDDGPGGLSDGYRAFLLDASSLLLPDLPGDFNFDGTVDAADYVVWRDSGSPDGYTTWRANFGATLGAGSGSDGYLLGASVDPLPAAVPEPSSLLLLALAVPTLLRLPSRERRTLRRANPERATRRPRFELLEDRRMLSFTPAGNYATIGTPSAIVTADFNIDGNVDLATCAAAATGSFSVLLGDGAGGFGETMRTVIGTNLVSLAAADFNNDTRPDMLVSDGSGFYLLKGNGDGTFQSPTYTFGGEMATVGHFNSDNYLDVLVTWLDGDWATHLQIYFGDGQDGFKAGLDTYYWGWGRMLSADLNNDGKLDVATSDGVVFLGYGNGTFHYDWGQQSQVGGAAIAMGDLTGDGHLDAVVAGRNVVSVLPGKGDGYFDQPITQSVSVSLPSGVATADFNGDGKLDAIVTDRDSNTVSVMLGSGDGTLQLFSEFSTGKFPSGVVVGDFNHDGRPDVAVSNAGWESRTISILLNDGIWPGAPPDLPGDYNQNGTVDIADYVVWRDTLGSSVAPSTGADGNGDSEVNHDDLGEWQSRFGQSAPLQIVALSGAIVDSSSSHVVSNPRPSRALRGMDSAFAGNPRDDALVAWMASQVIGPKQLEDSEATDTRDHEEAIGADAFDLDTLDHVFAQLTSN